MFIKEITVKSNVGIVEMVSLIQDTISSHLESKNIGLKDVVAKNEHWVIARHDIKINRLPKRNEKITIKTYMGDDMKYIYPRYANVYDMHNNIIMQTSSLWVLINGDNRTICLDNSVREKIEAEHLKDELPMPIKDNYQNTSFFCSCQIKENQIDLNKHLNNIEYLKMLFSAAKIKESKINLIHLEYEKEIAVNDVIKIGKNDENEYVFNVNGEIHFKAKIK